MPVPPVSPYPATKPVFPSKSLTYKLKAKHQHENLLQVFERKKNRSRDMRVWRSVRKEHTERLSTLYGDEITSVKWARN